MPGAAFLGWAVAAIQTIGATVLVTLWMLRQEVPRVDTVCPICPDAEPMPSARVARPEELQSLKQARSAPVVTPTGDESDGPTNAWEQFLAWSKANGIEAHEALLMRDGGRGRPRGLYARGPIPANATLLTVPAKAMFTVPACLKHSPLAAAALRLWDKTSDSSVERSVAKLLVKTPTGEEEAYWLSKRKEWHEEGIGSMNSTVLALCLLEESAKGKASHWAPWISLLPRDFSMAPLGMQEDDLKSCLDGAGRDIVEAAARWKKASLNEFLLLSRELEGMRRFSYKEFLNWQLLLASRTHGFRFGPKHHELDSSYEAKGLVPYADMINHRHDGRSADWHYDAAHDTFLVRAKATGIETDSEITLSYGVEGDAELFLFYGFSDGTARRKTSLHLEVDIRLDPLAWPKRESLMQLGLYHMWPLKSEAPMSAESLHNLLVAARIIAATTEEEIELAAKAPSAKDFDPHLEARALSLLGRTARAARIGQNPGQIVNADLGTAGNVKDVVTTTPCSLFRERERELNAEVEVFAALVLGSFSGSAQHSSITASKQLQVSPWLQARAVEHASWYAANQPFGGLRSNMIMDSGAQTAQD